jgi:hypothetical protein
VNPDDFDKVLSRKGGDFVQFDTNNDPVGKKKGKNKKRGRKNQYYTQIDAEDDEEASVLGYDEDATANAAAGKDDLGVIKEEEDDEDDVRNKSPAKKGAKQLQSQSNLLKSQEAELIKKRQMEEEAIQRRIAEEEAAAQRELQNKIVRE